VRISVYTLLALCLLAASLKALKMRDF